MGQVIIQPETPKNPIELIGKMIGVCYGSNTTNPTQNYKRGLNSIKAKHGRVLEYATAWFILEGYSARVIREWYTHIGGAPTRTQASTRYIDYGNFKYITSPSIVKKGEQCQDKYDEVMQNTIEGYKTLINDYNIPPEDAAMVLPLGMTTTVSCHYNIRTLSDMSRQRLCSRAYWEYRQLMRDVIDALSAYSPEWRELCVLTMGCKCDILGYCEEEFSCGKYPKKKHETIALPSKYSYNQEQIDYLENKLDNNNFLTN